MSTDAEFLAQLREALTATGIVTERQGAAGDRELAARLRRVATLLDRQASGANAATGQAQGVPALLTVSAPAATLAPAGNGAAMQSSCVNSAAHAAAAQPQPPLSLPLPQRQLQPSSSVTSVEGVGAAAAAQGFSDTSGRRPGGKRKGGRTFDFGRYETRHVVLEVCYLGWRYHGFAAQAANGGATVEGALFSALRTCRLVPQCGHWSEAGYSRCGRTDKGVSALGQVVALHLRSATLAGQPLVAPEQELDYPLLLNRALPEDIRVLGWAPAPDPTFNARFSCRQRHYKYFITNGGGLDIAAMQAAAAHFVGEHDFRNFCKMDAEKVHSFVRRCDDVSLSRLEGPALPRCGLGGGQLSVYVLDVKGSGFLWHQVRCMVAVLMMVGRRQEQAAVVRQLLDVGRHPRKPQYTMAAEEPLILYACSFEGLTFRRSAMAFDVARQAVDAMLSQHLISTALLAAIAQRYRDDEAAGLSGEQPGKTTKHVPLLRRATESTWEERLEALARKGRSGDAEMPDAGQGHDAEQLGGMPKPT